MEELKLRVEELEERIAPATFTLKPGNSGLTLTATVTSTSLSGSITGGVANLNLSGTVGG